MNANGMTRDEVVWALRSFSNEYVEARGHSILLDGRYIGDAREDLRVLKERIANLC